jgi:hypothetical protein
LGIAGLLLLRLAAGELQPMAGHVGGQVAKSGGGRVVAGGAAIVGGLAPDAQPGLAERTLLTTPYDEQRRRL